MKSDSIYIYVVCYTATRLQKNTHINISHMNLTPVYCKSNSPKACLEYKRVRKQRGIATRLDLYRTSARLEISLYHHKRYAQTAMSQQPQGSLQFKPNMKHTARRLELTNGKSLYVTWPMIQTTTHVLARRLFCIVGTNPYNQRHASCEHTGQRFHQGHVMKTWKLSG